MYKKILSILLSLILVFPIVSFASDENWNNYRVSSWHDEITGYDIYNLDAQKENTQDTVLIHDPVKDEWFRLNYKYRKLYEPHRCLFPEIIINIDNVVGYNLYDGYKYYDISNNKLVFGKQYYVSPDKKWGIGSIARKILLKNFEDGSIVECFDSLDVESYHWFPDSTLLLCEYSESERQNVIYNFDPETKKYTKIVSGTIRGYCPEKNLILFVKNEPTRKERIMDLTNKKWRFAQEDDRKLFHKEREEPKLLLPPKDLNIEKLRRVTPELVVQYEHEIHAADKVVKVPFVFERKNNKFIPIRSLMKPFNIKVDMIKDRDLSKQEFYISYNGKKIKLSEDESKQNKFVNYDGQLFVTPQVFEKLGFPKFTIVPIKAK